MSKNDEFCIKSEELGFKNEELCITNEEFCIKMMNFAGESAGGAGTDWRWQNGGAGGNGGAVSGLAVDAFRLNNDGLFTKQRRFMHQSTGHPMRRRRLRAWGCCGEKK